MHSLCGGHDAKVEEEDQDAIVRDVTPPHHSSKGSEGVSLSLEMLVESRTSEASLILDDAHQGQDGRKILFRASDVRS